MTSNLLVHESAAKSIAETAKALATPFSSEQSNLTVLRMGAEHVLHELEMEIIRDPKRSISTLKLIRRFRAIRDALSALRAEGKS